MYKTIFVGDVIVRVCLRRSGALWVWGCGFTVFGGGSLLPVGVCSLGGFVFAPGGVCSFGSFLWVCVCMGGLFAPFGACGGGGGGDHEQSCYCWKLLSIYRNTGGVSGSLRNVLD